MSAAAPASSRRARILKRTFVGAGLAAAVALLLTLSARSEDGGVVLVAGGVLALLAALEVARMRPLGATVSLTPVLLPVAALGAALSARALGDLRAVAAADGWLERSRLETYSYEPVLAAEAFIVLLAALGLGELLSWSRSSGGRRAFALLTALLAAWVVLRYVPPHGAGLPDDMDLSWVDGGPWFFALELAVVALPVALHGLWRRESRERWLTGIFALWTALPLVWLWHVWQGFGQGGLIALLLLSKLGDIAGYYVGSAIGVRHPFPRISPGKTVAGCWASLATGVLAGVALVALGLLPSGGWGLGAGALVGGITNVAAQAGDLFESWVKRTAGVKDSGTWFGPSGGVLDLVDSLLFSVPVALVTWPLLLA